MAGGNHNDGDDPASPWEQAQTEPLPRRHKSSLHSSSLDAADDPDRTLPLPDHGDEASEHVERLLHLLAREGMIGEGDAAAVLSHLMRLRNISSGGGSNNNDKGDNNDDSGDNDNDGGLQWSAANVRFVRSAVKSALRSLRNNGTNASSNSNATSTTDSNANNNGVMAHMDPPTARRVLTDGILPLAGAAPSTSGRDIEETTRAVEGGSAPPCVWMAKLVRSMVVEDLLPMALEESADNADETDAQSDADSGAEGCEGSCDATGVEVLLSTFLTRMDADESSPLLANDGNNHAAYTVDDILDRLCGAPQPSSGSPRGANKQNKPRLRPTATAAVLNSLRELESNVPGGRLSRRRVWKTPRGNGNIGTNGPRKRECQYEHVDRPTHLLDTALHSLQRLANSVRNGTGDPDTVPPLVYQLALLPMGLCPASGAASSGGGGKGEKKKENPKQRAKRMRGACLEGIARILDDDDGGKGKCAGNEGNGGIALHDGTNANTNQPQKADPTPWRHARRTSLAHLGSALRSDPAMGAAVLSMLAGDNPPQGAAPFRYARLTPFRLSVGLAMASSVPRMRASALEAVRDLVLEEETLRVRRGRGGDGLSVGMGRPWMDCLVRCLEDESNKGGDGDAADEGTGHWHHVLRCLLGVAKFAEGEHHGGGGGGRGCAGSSLLQSLTQLGFLLVDCVKKDEPASATSVTGADALKPMAMLAPTLDVAAFDTHAGSPSSAKAETSPAHAASSLGRFLLSYLFYRSAAAASPFLSSSISLGGGNSHRGSSDGGTALCRSILRSAIDKFCCMAPNASEHASLLNDLLGFSPSVLKGLLEEECSSSDVGDMEGLDDAQKRQVIPLALASNHLPNLIDTLSNVPSGGMAPHVASSAVVPAVGHILLVQATQQRLGMGTLWKRSDLADHVDHAFLLAKKALFSADVEKRRCAANLLVTLLGVAAVASSSSRSGSSNVWSSILYDMKGCLRRCLTQHQPAVRTEAYSSLVALLPKSVSGAPGNASTQGSVSPASTVSGGATTPPPAASSSLRGTASPALSIPPAGQNALVCIVSELLLSSLERYVTIPKEELTDREARRKRSAQGVGLSQMEVAVEEDSPELRKGGEEERSNPFRFQKCISARPSNLHADGNLRGGGKKKAKSAPIGQTLLTEALNRINEPLPTLISSCVAVTPLLAADEAEDDDDAQNGNEMKKALRRIRKQMASCVDTDEYLKWIKNNKAIFDIKDNTKRAEEMAIAKLATLILVATIADVLLCTSDWDENETTNGVVIMEVNGSSADDVTNDIEDLFSLRAEAIEEAALIMSSFVASKPAKKKKSTKKLKEVDANLSSSQNGDDEEPKKKKGKAAAATATITKVKESDINDATRARNRKLVEDVLLNMSPATSHEFLAEALRRFGAGAEKAVAADSDDSDDEDEDGNANARLARCVAFRRYIISKCLLLMSGSSPLVKAGARFGPLVGPGMEMEEKSASTARIAASMTLGPLLFAEFCAHSHRLERTSLASRPASSSQANSELSLAQLSMRTFVTCVRGLSNAPRHALSKATRVKFLLSGAIGKASIVVPSSKDGWRYYQESVDDGSPCVGAVPGDDLALGKTLYPLISLAATTSSDEKGNDGSTASTTRLSLFSELLANGLYGEAAELSHLISTAGEAFGEPNMKEQLGVILLRAWEFGEGNRVGVLGLDHGEEGGVDKSSCVSLSIKVALKLNSGLDGNTHVPFPGGPSSPRVEVLRASRSKMGLPTSLMENWPDRHQKRLEKESNSPSGIIGIAPQVAWALSASAGVGENFNQTFDTNSPTKKQLKLDLIKAAAPHASERSSIASTIASSIDDALNNAEFVTHKMIPHMAVDGSVDLAQRFVSCLLFSASKMIGAAAPSAEFCDANGAAITTLLKSTKRLYGILAKLMLSFVNNPEALTSKETKCFLGYVVATLMPRVSALLLTLHEKQETSDGKFLAESKIESHGKTSALLVFEKEKLDNALLKVGAKLKQVGLEEESEWLEEHVVSNLSRDFKIKNVEDAKAREAPKRKPKKESSTGAKKRKVKSEPGVEKKQKKKKKRVESEAEDESEGEDAEESVMESVDADESIDDGSDVLDLERLTDDMQDDDDDDEEEEEEEESESEEEAEFDD